MTEVPAGTVISAPSIAERDGRAGFSGGAVVDFAEDGHGVTPNLPGVIARSPIAQRWADAATQRSRMSSGPICLGCFVALRAPRNDGRRYAVGSQ